MQPLSAIRVLDFSTLLPGPLATLLLAEAGAEVIKIEQPGTGDEARHYPPRAGADGVSFAQLNRGKRSIALDLKQPGAIERLRPLIEGADIVVEQFRPTVMDRLGLGYETLKQINPRIIYCAITGYGQDGPRAQVAAHDLNYIAQTGLLALSAGADGAPVIPPALIADIAGGAYPAVMNILLALRERELTGVGCKLDISMTDHLFPLTYWALAQGFYCQEWPRPGAERLTGGSPRYHIYRSADGRYLAAAPLEDRFWRNFCEAIALPEALRDDARDPAATIAAVAELIARHDAEHWRARFSGKDVCCNVVLTLEEAVRDPHFVGRGLFARRIAVGAQTMVAAPVPVLDRFRAAATEASYPALGEANALLTRE